MMKKKKKALLFFLCAMVTLTACAKDDAAPSPNSSPDSSPVKADPFGKYDQLVTLTAARELDSGTKFNPSNPEQKSIQENVWQTAYKDYLNININYIWTPAPAEYNTKWNTAIASNNIPDIAPVDATIYKQLLEAGLVEDMTDYFEAYASDLYKQYVKDDGGITMNFMKTNGRLYGLPITGTQPDDSNLLWIRKDWLDKVGLPEPKTMDELYKVAKAFVDAKLGGKDTYGISANDTIDTYSSSLVGFLNGFGAYYNIWIKDEKTGKLAYSTIQPETRTALLKLQEMYKQGLIRKDFAAIKYETAVEDVVSGKVGIEFGKYGSSLGEIQNNLAANPSAKWKVLEIPTNTGSPVIVQGSATPSRYLFVKKGIKHPEAAVKIENLNASLITFPEYKPEKYSLSTDGISLAAYKFAPINPPWKGFSAYKEVSTALTSGDASKLSTVNGAKIYYDKIKQAGSGATKAASEAYNLIFGNESAFKVIEQLRESNRIKVDAAQTLPTKTQSYLGDSLKTPLDTAMLAVIMGDDINVFDKAVTAWKNGGGDTITNELNKWYDTTK